MEPGGYVAIPGVNMDAAHVEALKRELQGLRYILNVIPWNETGVGYRAPSWAEVKEFTTALRALECPVKIRYSGGKQECLPRRIALVLKARNPC